MHSDIEFPPNYWDIQAGWLQAKIPHGELKERMQNNLFLGFLLIKSRTQNPNIRHLACLKYGFSHPCVLKLCTVAKPSYLDQLHWGVIGGAQTEQVINRGSLYYYCRQHWKYCRVICQKCLKLLADFHWPNRVQFTTDNEKFWLNTWNKHIMNINIDNMIIWWPSWRTLAVLYRC